jgi:ABC-type sugar transport system substrate-binding protein
LGSKIEVLDSVNSDLDQRKALVASRDLITRFGDKIDGVYANDGTMARGFIDACKEASPHRRSSASMVRRTLRIDQVGRDVLNH